MRAFVRHGALADGQGDADDGEGTDDQGDPLLERASGAFLPGGAG
ncbi:MAG: hypothetical protein WBG53_00775 [Rhodococcus sp. (in: high G+C Gram-positive bacteria)]|nr:hypothetical protein [Rhodococcus sp. SBT000017]